MPRFPFGLSRPPEAIRRRGCGDTADRGQQRGGQSVILLRLSARRDAFHQPAAQFAHAFRQPFDRFFDLAGWRGLLAEPFRQVGSGLLQQDSMPVSRFQFLVVAAQPEIQVGFRAARELLEDITLPDDLDDGGVVHLAPQRHRLFETHLPLIYYGDTLLEGLNFV